MTISRELADEIAKTRIDLISEVSELAFDWAAKTDHNKFIVINRSIAEVQSQMSEWKNDLAICEAMQWEIDQLKRAGEFFADSLAVMA